jgi:molybdate transport system regulatory protein
MRMRGGRKTDRSLLMTDRSDDAVLKIKPQVMLGGVIAIGPGKADLLEAVAATGSIAAAGRKLGLSYRRTRDMIDVLNATWRVPLVEAAKGGARGGGTTLTAAGAEVLRAYRALQAALDAAAEGPGGELLGLAGRSELTLRLSEPR